MRHHQIIIIRMMIILTGRLPILKKMEILLIEHSRDIIISFHAARGPHRSHQKPCRSHQSLQNNRNVLVPSNKTALKICSDILAKLVTVKIPMTPETFL